VSSKHARQAESGKQRYLATMAFFGDGAMLNSEQVAKGKNL
jgi:hypothetical protein